MGKKSKRKNKKVELPFVSVCTPTFNRRPFIPSLIQCYKHQKYPNDRMEWIVIDDGTDLVEDLFINLDIPNVKYIKLNEKITLGKKRNLMHTYCKGEIIVYMDDDDYYPPTRVSHAVERLISNPKALAAGADAIMMGSIFAGTDESPGKKFKINGKFYKNYRGMGSIGAMSSGSANRYFQKNFKNKSKFVPEGVEGRVEYKGNVSKIIYQLKGGLRSSMGYIGARNLSQIKKNAEFIKITKAGFYESMVHSVEMTQKTINYKL